MSYTTATDGLGRRGIVPVCFERPPMGSEPLPPYHHTSTDPFPPYQNSTELYERCTSFAGLGSHSVGTVPLGSSSYTPDWTTSEYMQSQMETLHSPIPSMQWTTSPQAETKWVCTAPGCSVKPFARCADLERHVEHKHEKLEAEEFFCDHRNCPRSEKSHAAQAVSMGQAPSLSYVGGPFRRKDHYKAHLRDIHKEAIWKRSPKDDPAWLEGKVISEDWFRCPKCLNRVYHKKSGWKCNCGMTLETDVILQMEKKKLEARTRKRDLTPDLGGSDATSRLPRKSMFEEKLMGITRLLGNK